MGRSSTWEGEYMGFLGKNAIITGGANGIGRCIAEHLAHAGIGKVLIIDIDEKAGGDLLERYPDNIGFMHGDIADRAVIDAYISSLGKTPVDIVINNACIGRKGFCLAVRGMILNMCSESELQRLITWCRSYIRRACLQKAHQSLT
jgi:NAD(P)-dependent dehydrogenase (short-subunit alcohol dehydrogenase family)